MGNMNRRNFLKAIGAGVTVAGLGGSKVFVESAYAAPIAGRKVVNIFLNGGCDMFLVLQPTGFGSIMDQLRVNRPTLAQPLRNNGNPAVEYQRLALNGTNYTLHDRMTEFQMLYNRSPNRECAFVLKAGITVGNTGSHEEAQKDHQTGVVNGIDVDNRGWIQKVAESGGFPDSLSVVDLTGGGLATGATAKNATFRPLSARNLAEYGFRSEISQGSGGDNGFRINTALSVIAQQGSNPNEAIFKSNWSQLSATVAQVQAAYSAEIGALTGGFAFPNTSIGRQLRDIFISFRRLPTRIGYAEVGGYDRHDFADPQGQAPNARTYMSAYLQELNAAVAAFRLNCERVNIWQDMMIIINTEFGRTNRENSTLGLDHADASLAILVGGAIRGGIYGQDFTVAELTSNQNGVDAQIKIRDIYCDLIQGLSLNPATVFPGFQRSPLNLVL
jgi:uncharacterized protein (DUF1501 family)